MMSSLPDSVEDSVVGEPPQPALASIRKTQPSLRIRLTVRSSYMYIQLYVLFIIFVSRSAIPLPTVNVYNDRIKE